MSDSATTQATTTEAPSPGPGAPQEGGAVDSLGTPKLFKDDTAPATEAAPTDAAPSAETPAATEAAPPEPPKPPQAKDGPTEQDWAAYHRKVKEFRRQQEEVKAQAARVKQLEETLARAKENPLALLEAAGLSYEQLTQAVLRDGQEPTPDDRVRSLEEKLAAIEAEKQQQLEAARQAQRQQVVESAKAQAIALAKKEAAKFKGLAALGDEAKETVWAMAQELMPEYGEELTDSLVLEQAETRLRALWERLNGVYGAPSPAPASETKTGASANGSKTLTARGVSGMAPTAVNGEAPLPLRPEERDRAILQQFKFFR